jgi:excisionase family DNA binding protein
MKPEHNLDPLLDTNDVVRITRLGASTVRHKIASGELRSLKLGDRRLIRPEDLREFINRAVVAA